MSNNIWWPFELAPELDASFRTYKEQMAHRQVSLNKQRISQLADQLGDIMASHVPDIIERDGLPYLCHIINGWGNATYRQREMISEMLPFVHYDGGGNPFILQCEPEGDFHPWQAFAYAVMAGVDPDAPIGQSDITLRQLGRHTRQLNIGKEQGHELGHLLYALSHLEPSKDIPPFIIGGEPHDLKAVMDMAIDAHYYGSFDVCRKVHLTEGICAISHRVEGFSEYRAVAEQFLHGQLDILFLLCMTLEESQASLKNGILLEDNARLKELRDVLKISNFLENHAFYVGHLVELATLAAQCGFTPGVAHVNAMYHAVNLLNEIIPDYLPYIYFEDCFLHFGHYRRGITLLQELDVTLPAGTPATLDLAAYTVNLDERTPWRTEPAKITALSEVHRNVFRLAKPVQQERDRFLTVLHHYAKVADKDLEARGGFKHFRRIGPPSWPRSFHYEFLDYGDKIGIEVHIESDAVEPMNDVVQAVTPKVQSLFPDRTVQWDNNWYKNRGRLQILFEEEYPEEALSGAMRSLIAATYSDFHPVASNIRIIS